MDPRLKLQSILEELLGSRNVYFQPPENIQMQFPAIVYSRESDQHEHANNALYLRRKRYQVTVIDRNPDSAIPDKVAALPLSSFSRHFVVDNLNHDVFSVFDQGA